MEAEDKSWDLFLDEYTNLLTKYEALKTKLEGYENGKNLSNSESRNETEPQDEEEARLH